MFQTSGLSEAGRAARLGAGVTEAATAEIVKAVAGEMGLHVNSVYKMWHEPEFDRFIRMLELYLATARVDWRRGEFFYQQFKQVRDAEALRHARVLVTCPEAAAAEACAQCGDIPVAELEHRSVQERLKEVREAQVALEEYAMALTALLEPVEGEGARAS